MKILLVARGTQGDVYPYLALASELKARGHEVTVNVPQLFEKEAKAASLSYFLQESDDIGGMMSSGAEKSQKAGSFLQWTRNNINKQFKQLIPELQKNDLLVATNTEFAATSVAEFCRKPVIRTAYAPLIPGKKIAPPLMPLSKPNRIITPALLWRILNAATNLMVKGTINKNRIDRGLKPVRNFGRYATGQAHNYLMYSQYLGSTDPDWNCVWKIGGYCFNDAFSYDPEAVEELMTFVRQDDRPVLFFTLGSCSAKKSNRLCEQLAAICTKHRFRLIVGSGWSKTGSQLKNGDSLFRLEKPVPHHLIFDHCRAVMHHGGSGTTHSAARAGKPQLIVPLIIDQQYWAGRAEQLGLGPQPVRITDEPVFRLEQKVCDLMQNPCYKKNALRLREKIAGENGIRQFADYIETFRENR